MVSVVGKTPPDEMFIIHILAIQIIQYKTVYNCSKLVSRYSICFEDSCGSWLVSLSSRDPMYCGISTPPMSFSISRVGGTE